MTTAPVAGETFGWKSTQTQPEVTGVPSSLAVLASESSGRDENFASFDVPIWIWFAFLALDLGPAHRRPAAGPPHTARADHQGGGHRVGGVDQHRRRLHRGDVRLARRPGRRRVHLRLPDREEPQRRQRVRVGADHELLRRAPGVTSSGCCSGASSAPWCCASSSSSPGWRCSSSSSGCCSCSGRSCWSPRSACCATARRTRSTPSTTRCCGWCGGSIPSTTEYNGQQLFVKHGRKLLATPAAGRAHRHRDQRRGVRGRLDPRHPGGQPRAVHRVQLERLRHPRACGRSTSCWPTCATGSASCSRAWRSSSPSSASR